jgi:hypothetical protein
VFHGLRAPPISIEAYLVRIAKYAKCSPACFAHSMVHMLKLAQQDTSFAPTRLNVHRLVLTGVLISAKFLDDRYFNNAFYAKVRRLAAQTLVVPWVFLPPPPGALLAMLLCWGLPSLCFAGDVTVLGSAGCSYPPQHHSQHQLYGFVPVS